MPTGSQNFGLDQIFFFFVGDSGSKNVSGLLDRTFKVQAHDYKWLEKVTTAQLIVTSVHVLFTEIPAINYIPLVDIELLQCSNLDMLCSDK